MVSVLDRNKTVDTETYYNGYCFQYWKSLNTCKKIKMTGTGRNWQRKWCPMREKKYAPEAIIQWLPFPELEKIKYRYGFSFKKKIKTTGTGIY